MGVFRFNMPTFTIPVARTKRLLFCINTQLSSTPTATSEAKYPPPDGTVKQEIQKMAEDLSIRLKKVESSLSDLKSSVRDVQSDISDVKNDTESFKQIKDKPTEGLEQVHQRLNSTEQLLEKYENKLSEYNNRIPTDVSVPINYEDQDNWQKTLAQGKRVKPKLSK